MKRGVSTAVLGRESANLISEFFGSCAFEIFAEREKRTTRAAATFEKLNRIKPEKPMKTEKKLVTATLVLI